PRRLGFRVRLLVREIEIRRLRLELGGARIDSEPSWQAPLGSRSFDHAETRCFAWRQPLGGRNLTQPVRKVRMNSWEVQPLPCSFEQEIPAFRDRIAAPCEIARVVRDLTAVHCLEKRFRERA